MKIDQSRDVLLVVDVQNDFCPGGALPVPYGYEVVPKINWMAQQFDNVILTQDWHPARHTSFASTHGMQPYTKVGDKTYWPDHCVQGTKGADFHPGLDIPHAQMILRKGWRKNLDSYSAFMENDSKTSTGLRAYTEARGLDRFFIVGLAFDYCVRYTAEDAFIPSRSNNVFVIEDGCRSIGDKTETYDGLKRMFCQIVQSEDLIF